MLGLQSAFNDSVTSLPANFTSLVIRAWPYILHAALLPFRCDSYNDDYEWLIDKNNDDSVFR